MGTRLKQFIKQHVSICQPFLPLKPLASPCFWLKDADPQPIEPLFHDEQRVRGGQGSFFQPLKCIRRCLLTLPHRAGLLQYWSLSESGSNSRQGASINFMLHRSLTRNHNRYQPRTVVPLPMLQVLQWQGHSIVPICSVASKRYWQQVLPAQGLLGYALCGFRPQ